MILETFPVFVTLRWEGLGGGAERKGGNKKEVRESETWQMNCVRISMLSYMWQMYTIHSNIKVVYTRYIQN